MNTRQIEAALRKRCKHAFMGVYARDRIPTQLPHRRPLFMVVNTDPHHRPGEHWIVLYFAADGWGEFFDSYGQRPDQYFSRYLDKFSSKWIFNSKKLQSILSRFCGHYCIFYALFKCLGYSMKDITNCFLLDDTGLNDALVHKFVCETI